MILIVRHGKGRARLYPYLDPYLQYVRSCQPELYRMLLLYETGSPLPRLDEVASVVIWLGDPLRERYSSCYAQAVELANLSRSRNLCIVNPPEALSNTVKSVQSRLWRQEGISTPLVYRFETREELLFNAGRLGYPLLVRSDERHSQKGVVLCSSRSDVERIPGKKLIFPGAISRIIDVRESFRAQNSKNIWSHFFHKKRLLVLGNKIRTKHVFFGSNPIVSSKTCRLRFFQHLGAKLSWMTCFDSWSGACIDEDMKYWQEGHEHDETMLRAMKVLGLSFGAIDYSSLADGSVVLWEVNPYFHLPQEADIMVPHRRKAKERILSYYNALGEFLTGLPGGNC